MKNNQVFDKFKSKLTLEAVLNSVLSGAGIGFAVGGIIALVSWLCGYKTGVWIAIGAGAGIAIIVGLLCYFLKFRPTVESIARRADALGLKERAVTMLDYEDDGSEMAAIQREDAMRHIAAASPKNVKINVPKWLAGAFSGAAVFGITFSLVCALYMGGVVQSPSEGGDTYLQHVAVTYFVDEGGEIDGETDQLLRPGEDATAVTAVAMDGYVFVGWSDGNKNTGRIDLNITEDFEVTAMFEPIDEGMNGEEGDFDGPAGDDAGDLPADGDGEVVDGGEGDGSGNKGDGEGTGSGNDKGEGKGDGQGEGAGGKFSESNQIIDGSIYYRDKLEEAYDEVMRELADRKDIPDELREFIEAYFKGL